MSTDINLLEQKTQEIGRTLGSAMPPGTGFALMLFDFEERPGGFLTYVSNAHRADLIKVLRETADWLERGMKEPAKGMPRA